MGTNVNKKNMNKEGAKLKFSWESKEKKQLVEALLSIKNADEARRFLRDLMTEAEINEFTNRLEAARLLTNSVQYNAIIERTGLSSTTIARISKWLKGPLAGYKLILNRLSNTNSTKLIASHHNPIQMRKGLPSSA